MKEVSLVVLWTLAASVLGYTEIPNPQKEWRMCGRPKPSFVCDPDFVLDRGQVEKLDQIAMEFQKSTSCLCPKCIEEIGIPLGIFIKYNLTKEMSSEYTTGKDLSEMIRRRWSLSKCDGDIIIVLAIQQNISDFILGPSVRKIFPDGTASNILRDCMVHFESGYYYQGLESVINSFNDELIKVQKHTIPVFKNMILGIALGFGVLLILAVTAVVILHQQARKRRRDRCSDIFESDPINSNGRKASFNQERHLERLKKLTNDEDDENDDASQETFEFKYHKTYPSVQFTRMQRQLSDVTEESSDDSELMRRSSGHASSYSSSFYMPKGSVPVTEL